MTHEGKSIPVGVRTDNTCCITCRKCGAERCDAAYELVTEGRCCEHSSEPNHTGLCVTSCCACPPLGNVCATLDTGGTCPSVDGMEITLTQSAGVTICSGENPMTRAGGVMCYPESPVVGTLKTGIQEFNNNYEKWGFSGLICDGLTVAGCSETTAGEFVKISLCCCDMCNEHSTVPGVTGADDNSCSYRLTFEWMEHEVDGEDQLCTCPEGGHGGAIHLVPTCTSETPDCSILYWDLTHEVGNCGTGTVAGGGQSDFLLRYELSNREAEGGGWWNCDCCQNGEGASDNDVEITVTITAGDC